MTEREIFLAALDLPEADRAAYLDQACGGDAALRSRVDALLRSHRDAGSFLGSPAVAAAFTPDDRETAASPAEAPGPATVAHAAPDDTGAPGPPPAGGATRGEGIGAVIAGRYTLVELIGEGGMGLVYRATQTEPVRRQVALKLIKAGMDSRVVLARFDAERQALALMDHPHIAKVFDGGTTGTGNSELGTRNEDPPSSSAPRSALPVPRSEGRPFFVMELVAGVPLTDYCDRKRLSVEDRLRLFVLVCQAVQHAHQKGIIHRDLKPGNVLVTEVDGRPTPKVIDFGVAKATEQKLTDLSLADTGAIVGTPAYMSPEQADPSSVDIDTRTDVYALGVILYELLAGSPPLDAGQFKRGAILEMLRMVREVEPPRPSTKLSTADALPNIAANRSTEPATLAKMLQGELDWVVMKALEKDRARRYETANGLARDLQRYLADEVVEARPPSRGYRLRKFLRRNKGPVLAVGSLLVALVGGVIGTTLGLVEARNQTRVAEQEARDKEEARRKEAEQRELAERANRQAYEALKAFTDDLMGKVLGSRTRLTDTEKAILDNARKQWEVFARSKGTSPEARVVRADGAMNLALVQFRLGLFAEAEANERLALDLRAALAAEFPDVPRHRYDVARGHQNLARTLRGTGKGPEAEAHFAEAAVWYGRLVADFPDDAAYRYWLGESHISLANALRDRGELAASADHYRTALGHQAKLVAAHPAERRYRWGEARSHWGLAFVAKRLKNWAESEGHYRQAIAVSEELAARFPADALHAEDIAGLRRELATLLSDSGNPAASAPEYVKAIDHQAKLAADFPSVPGHQQALARSRRDYAKALGKLGRRPEAVAQLVLAEAGLERLVADSPAVLPYQADLGLTYSFHGDLEADGPDPARGLPWYDKAIHVLTATHAQDPKHILVRGSLAKAHGGRAATLDKLRRHAAAAPDWEKAVELSPADARRAARLGRAESWARGGRAADAVAEVESLAAQPEGNATEWYDFARVYALAGGNIADKKPEYADRAMAMLRRAVDAGYRDAARMKQDEALDSLRDRDDFKKLLADLGKLAPEPPEIAPPPRAGKSAAAG